MLHETSHLSDQEILLAVDDELAPSQRTRVYAHLAACSRCQVRLTEIEDTFGAFACLQRSESVRQLPPADGARALLKARLAEFSRPRGSSLRPYINDLMTASLRWVLAATALFFVALGMWTLQREARPPETLTALVQFDPGPIPDKQLTPGATLRVSKAEVCSASDSGETHPIPLSMRQKVFQEYRTPESHAAEYEIDFLITPGLGGADDIRNLWPEPYSSTVWNAHVKDALEDRLHDMVCAGQLDLATAQRDIATDWISAYKKYFHTQSPLSTRSSFTSDHL